MSNSHDLALFCQDVNEQIWRIYTTWRWLRLCRGEVNEQFEGYTQQLSVSLRWVRCCFVRMSMNKFEGYTQHPNLARGSWLVVLSGCQWTIWRIYTTPTNRSRSTCELFYQDFNEQFCCKSTKNPWNLQIYWKIFWYFRKKHYLCSNKFEGYTQ